MRHTFSFPLFRDQRGIVLVVALMLMGLMSALAAAYSTMIRADTFLRGAAGRERKGFYAAEDGLNVAMARTRTMFDNFTPPPPGAVIRDTITVGSGAQQRTVPYELKGVPECEPCDRETIGAGSRFAGLSSIPYRYTLTAMAKNTADEEEAKLGADFTIHNIPIFQFLAFYKNDLYISPRPVMTLNGRIHTNGDLRLNGDTGNLHIASSPSVPLVQVSAGNKIYRGSIKYGTRMCRPNSVFIDRRSDNTALALDPCDENDPIPQTTIDGYMGSVLADVAGIELPDARLMARGAGNPYWDKADLRIVLNLTTRIGNFCTGLPFPDPGLFSIEVQDQNGLKNNGKTAALERFMCQRRGAIFYTDVPTAAGATGAGLGIDRTGARTNVSEQPDHYTPSFGTIDAVYRRVGEDTNGNGIINNRDSNDDICPTEEVVGAGAAPWWKPESCPWPLTWAAALATSWYKDNDYRRGGFYNRREDRWMYLLNVNVRALLEWNAHPAPDGGAHALISAAGLADDGGVVLFLSVQGADSLAVAPGAANNYGVRIFDSADLDTRGATFPFPAPADPTGITIVSDQAAYIEGNFNVIDKYPAAIMGDALNILSQGWEVPTSGMANDRKSTNTLLNRRVPASDDPCGGAGCLQFNFGINAGFIAGTGPSPGGEGHYDGGLENYPRFHEYWTDRALQIAGSFVSLGISRHAVNNWAVSSGPDQGVYDPPDRPWNYDADFNDVRNLPPMTPNITYIQQQMYTRFYQ